MTLSQVVQEIGTDVLRVVASAGEGAERVDHVSLHDPDAAPPSESSSLVLVAGPRLSDIEVERVLMHLKGATVSVVCARLMGSDPTTLVDISREAGIALVDIPAAVHWDRLYNLLRTAVLARRVPAVGVGPVQGGDLFTLANSLGDALGCPVAIDDIHFGTLAYSNLGGSDELRRQSVLARKAPDDWLQHLSSTGAMNRIKRPGEVVRVPPRNNLSLRASHHRVGIAVQAGNEQLGYIWIEETTQVTETGEDVLREGARIASLYMLRGAVSNELVDAAREQLVLALIEGDVTARERLGIPDGWSIAVLAIRLQEHRRTQRTPAHKILERLAQLSLAPRQHTYFCWSRSTLLGVVAEPGESHRVQVVAGFAHDLVAQAESRHALDVRVGISRFGEHVEAPALRLQAERAVTFLESPLARTRVGSIDEVERRAALNEIIEATSSIPQFMAGRITSITRDPSERGRARALALLSYLDHLGNVAEASRRSGIPANTLRYRVHSAVEQIGLDLEDPEAVLVVHLQLTIWRTRLDTGV